MVSHMSDPAASPESVSPSPADLDVLRHSTAHVMAEAVLSLWPEARYAIGPPIEDGFYYDFDIGRPFLPEDLQAIERKMRGIIAQDQPFIREEVKLPEALELFRDQPFKVEILEGIGESSEQGVDGEVVSLYRNPRKGARDGEGYVDLCRGPHLPSTGAIPAFKLLRSSGAYWRGGDAPPKPPRDYGTPPVSTEELDEQKYYVKPMSCPFHTLIYRSRLRSYRELPLRLFEFGAVYRYERSGVLHGLMRARGFTQDDAHIFVTEEQVVPELRSLLGFVTRMLRDFGFDTFEAKLSTRDPDKSVGTDEGWELATEALRQALEGEGVPYTVNEGDAAFYGPKIDIDVRDALGRAWQLSTLQVDFNLPERFDLTYVSADNERRRPWMIHRALFGSVERFFGVLVEHYAGAFPTWLAPVQAD